MISILVSVLVLLVVLYVARLVIAELGLPANITKIIYLILGLVALFWLLNMLGVYSFPLR